jgi:hypothetical protein
MLLPMLPDRLSHHGSVAIRAGCRTRSITSYLQEEGSIQGTRGEKGYSPNGDGTPPGCGGGAEHLCALGRFDRCIPAAIPTSLLKMSPSQGRASRGGKWGGGVTSPSSPSSSCPGHQSGGASLPSPLPSRLQSFTVDTVGLPPRHILR